MSRVNPFIKNIMLIFISMFFLLLASQAKALTITGADPSKITSPANGSTFTSTTVTFEWENFFADQYYLWIGTSQGGDNLYRASQGTNTSKTITNLPSNGSTIFVRMWSNFDGKWYYVDYTYTTVTETSDATRMTSPSDGSTFSSSSVRFEWEDVGSPQYYMWIGKSKGASDLYKASLGTNTSKTIGGFASDGSTVHVRLFTSISGRWFYRDYTYTTFTQSTSTEPARMTSPSNFSSFNSTIVKFQWENVGATEHWIWVGNTGPGTSNVFSNSQSNRTSLTLSGIPAIGGRVYVRLFSRFGSGAWKYNDYEYFGYCENICF